MSSNAIGLGRYHPPVDVSDRTLRAVELELPYIQKIVPSGRILDFGCGSGELSLVLMKAGYEVVGYDIQPESLETARRAGVDARTSLNNLGLFDAIVCVQVLQYLPDRMRTIQTLRGLLKPGGKLIVEKVSLSPALTFPQEELYRLPTPEGFELAELKAVNYFRRSTDSGAKRVAKEAMGRVAALLGFYTQELHTFAKQ